MVSMSRIPVSAPLDVPTTLDKGPDKKRYWMYAPGEGSYLRDEFYTKGIMGIVG